MSPAQLQAWYESWAASSRASAAGATYGAIEMPIVGGPSPGVSARGVSGYSGRGRGLAGLGDLPASTYTPGAQFECTDPVVLPVDTVDRPASGSVTRVVTVQGAAAAAGWPWGLIALLAGAVVLAAATSDGKPAPAERAGR
jgi:hypothetical protein